MRTKQQRSSWVLWAFAAALLLKSAMPFLASASAQAQGKTLVEVCTVYGVSTVEVADAQSDAASHRPAGDLAAPHGGDHCALTALTLLATGEQAASAGLPGTALAATLPRSSALPWVPDASATWVARLKHGPPSSS